MKPHERPSYWREQALLLGFVCVLVFVVLPCVVLFVHPKGHDCPSPKVVTEVTR